MTDDNDEDSVNLEFGITPLASKNAGHEHPVRPTVMESSAVAFADLPNFEEPVHSYIWREMFIIYTPADPTRLWRTFIASSTIVFARSTSSATHAPTSRTRVPTSTLQSQPLPPTSLRSSCSWEICRRGFRPWRPLLPRTRPTLQQYECPRCNHGRPCHMPRPPRLLLRSAPL